MTSSDQEVVSGSDDSDPWPHKTELAASCTSPSWDRVRKCAGVAELWACIKILALYLTCCEALGKYLNTPESSLPYLENGTQDVYPWGV